MSSFDFYSIEVTCFKSTIVACAALHFYYTVTHFDEEVEYIWSRKWTVGKIIYLLTRYLGTLFLICSVIGVKDCIWNDPRIPDGARVEHTGDDSAGSIATQESRSLNNFILTCFHGELFSGLGPMIILAAEVMLQMRVYALYGRDKRLFAFFILSTISLFGFNILQLSELFLHVENDLCQEPSGCFKFGFRGMSRGAFIPEPFAGHHSCLFFALPMAGIAWTVAALTEFLLFLLVIIKSRKRPFKSHEQGATHDICASMAKNSVAYFAVLFTIYLTGAIIIFVSERIDNVFLHLQVNSYETIAITATTILAPKLIINIRAECSSPSQLVESELTWNTDASEYILSDGVADSNGADAGRSSSPEPERP